MATVMERTENSKAVMRPGFGQAGRDINLTTNFFRLKYNSKVTVYQYDIEIEPECPKYLRRKLIHQFSQNHKADLFKSKLVTMHAVRKVGHLNINTKMTLKRAF